MPGFQTPLALLSAMITPAVLISACGTLIFSTSNRLTRIVDRVRELSHMLEQLFTGQIKDFPEEREKELNRQLAIYAKRSQLIQHSLGGFYIALAALVGTTVSIGLTAFIPHISWLPAVLGVAGTLVLFYSSVLLIAEARIALQSVNNEMEFTLRLSQLYRSRPRAPS
jgi:threonine/homoserine/homoserine lactone efflux protein